MNWPGHVFLAALAAGFGCPACRCGGTDSSSLGSEMGRAEALEPAVGELSARDLEGDDPPEPRSERCGGQAEARAIIGREADDELELGRARAGDFGFAVGAIRQGKSSKPFVSWMKDGKKSELPLPELHGDSPPPELALSGNSLVALVEGSDAGGRCLDLYRVNVGPEAKVDKGPTLGLDHRPFETAAVAASGSSVLVVWDTRVPQSGASSVRTQVLRSDDLAPKKSGSWLSARGVDAGQPRALGFPGGFFVLWLEYPPTSAKPTESARGLVESRQARLWITRLDPEGAAHGAPIALTRELDDLEYDATIWDGEPWVLLRKLPEDKLELLHVEPSGAVSTLPVRGSDLGPEPLGLEALPKRLLVLGQTNRGQQLLGFYSGSEAEVTLSPEPRLSGRDVLGTDGDKLVTLASTDGDVALELIECKASLVAAE